MPNTLSIKDLEEKKRELDERIAVMRRRDKATVDLKRWLAARKLTPVDLLAMYRAMKPKRSDVAVKSRKPLHAGGISQRSLKNAPKSSTGKFYIGPGNIYRGNPKSIKFLSADGKYVWGGLGRKPPWFMEHLKKGGVAEDLLLNKPPAARANGSAATAQP